MRKLFIPSLVLVVTAGLAVAATALGAGSTAAAAAAIPGCAPGSLNLVEDGVLTMRTDNPAYPPWYGGKQGHVAVEDRRPVQRPGLRVRRGVRGRQASSATRRAKVKWAYVPFVKSYAPGKKSFRLRHGRRSPTLPERAKVVDFGPGLLRREPGDRRPERDADREGAVDCGAEAVHARCAARHDELQVHPLDGSSRRASRSSTRTTRPSSR